MSLKTYLEKFSYTNPNGYDKDILPLLIKGYSQKALFNKLLTILNDNKYTKIRDNSIHFEVFGYKDNVEVTFHLSNANPTLIVLSVSCFSKKKGKTHAHLLSILDILKNELTNYIVPFNSDLL